MKQSETNYLWDILRLALFLEKSNEAQQLANNVYDLSRDLPSTVESEVVDYGVRGGKDPLIKIALALIGEPQFDGVERFILITFMVVSNELETIEALNYLSDASINKLKKRHRRLLSSLVDIAWHNKQDNEQNFYSVIDQRALRAEWDKAFEGLKSAAT